MRLVYVVHIAAGSLALLSGYVALFVVKGDRVHRTSGMVFVFAMLTMCLAGFSMAVGLNRAPAVNVPAALLTSYLVVTSLVTVRPPAFGSRWLLVVGLFAVLIVAVVDLVFGFEAIASGGKRNGIPAFPFILFGVVGLIAAAGDVRVLRRGALDGASRLVRHLWRMSFALGIAALSFFLGQAKVIPKPIRIPALLAIPVAAVFLAMFYWLWRVRIRRSLRGLVGPLAHSARSASVGSIRAASRAGT